MRLSVRFLSAALILALAWNASPAHGGDTDSPKEWAVYPLLPADTWFVITLRDKEHSLKRLQESGLWRLLSEKDLHAALNQPFTKLKAVIARHEQTTGYKLDETWELFQGEITVAMMGFTGEFNEQGEPIPDILIACQPRAKSDAFMKRWNEFVDMLNAKTQNTLVFNEYNVAGCSVTNISHPMAPFSITYSLADGVFLAGLGPSRIDSILAAREASKAPAKPADAPKTLADAPHFQRAIRKIGGAADLMAYLNLEKIKQSPDAKFGPKNDRERREWAAVGLDGIHSLLYGVSLESDGLKEAFYADAPKAGRKGLVALLDGPELTMDALAQAPRNTVAALALKAPPEQFVDRLLEIAALDNPNAKAEAAATFAEIGRSLGIDVRKDLLGALSGEAVLSLSVPSRNPKLTLGLPRPLLALDVADAAKAQKTLDSLQRAGKEKHDFSMVKHRSFTIYSAREKGAPGQEEKGMLCWTLAGNKLLMSLYPMALREELDRLTAGGENVSAGVSSLGGLAEDPDFRGAKVHLNASAQALAYVDFGALATAAYDVLVPLGQVNGKHPKWMDISALPTSDILARHLGGTVIALGSDEDGMSLQAFSSTGVFTTLFPIVAAAGEYLKKHGGHPPDIAAEPDLPADLVPKRQVLREIGKHLKTYARSNGGAYPATLTDLVPKYLKPEQKDHLFEIAYNGKQDEPFKVVAYLTGVKGAMPILLQDGSVRVIQSGQLDQVLNTGWTGEKAKPYELEAVKPPLPPPDF